MSNEKKSPEEPKAPAAPKKPRAARVPKEKLGSAPVKLTLKGLGLENILVNAEKAERAVRAANGAPKPDSAESVLLSRHRAGGLKGAELVQAIYEGLGGLVDKARAEKNRENEAKAARAKRNR